MNELSTRGSSSIRRGTAASQLISVVVVLGVLLRFAVFLFSARAGIAFWSTGNDSSAFVLLAHNLIDHRRSSIAGTPTAYRPPLHPLLIAVAMRITAHGWLPRKRIPYILFYAGVIVSTRLRVPLFDPVIIALAACYRPTMEEN